MKAVISNAKHPEYGQATIPLPIPAEQYDNVIGLLDALKIGDTVEQDCHVDELGSYYTVLKRLEGSTVNIDELDYLAKRLESFCEGEDAQYQGMAVKLGIYDIKDFIDLTFCCQEATVITNFSNLEKIGKDHLMTVNGGCMPTAQHDQADGRRIALDLIGNHDGYVTPYGVVYDNGMKLDQLYDGRHFPGYYYEPPVLAFEAISDEEGFTGLLSLPMPELQLTRMMKRAEIEQPDVHLTVSVDALPEAVSDALDLERLASEDLVGLNRLCKAVEFFNSYGMAKLNAAVMLTETSGIISLCRLAENIDMFDFIPDVHTPEEYGKCIIQGSGEFKYDESLDDFYDYAKFGAQQIREQGGEFNALGYVAYKGTVPLEELMLGKQSQQEPRMDGLSCT